MKKIIHLLLLFVCVCALSSCEKLFNNEMNSIAGTKWQHIEYNTPAGTVQTTLSFSSSTFSMKVNQSVGTNQSFSGKYEYGGGSGTMYLDGDPAYFSVSGHDLTLSYGGVRLAFTKK